LVRIDIRPAAVTDAEAIQRIYAPIVENTAVSFEYVPPSVVKMAGSASFEQ
jgi:L-amino acid N-acyltransferase YncA